MLNVLALLIFLPSLSHSDQTLSLELKSHIPFDGPEVFKWVEVRAVARQLNSRDPLLIQQLCHARLNINEFTQNTINLIFDVSCFIFNGINVAIETIMLPVLNYYRII